jgi:hypothetical protein
MRATCTGQPTEREAILVMKGSTTKILADVTDPTHPVKICTLTGGWLPLLVTSREISWWASQHVGQSGLSVIVTLDVFSGTSSVVASWQGGSFLDGVHAWSPHRDLLAYLTSDASGVNLHLLSGGGDRVVASLGPVPGRGVNSVEDDTFLQFSPDGAYFALVQTWTVSGAHLQVRRATNGSIAYSQTAATMATWGSIGSKLYFRHQQANLAFTVRDAAGTPHVWLFGHGGRAGNQLPNVRSSPVFLNAGSIFYIEEAPCGANCGPGPATQPNGRSYIYDLTKATETVSNILSVIAVWPQPGQV